jgi:DNA modification methylase
MQYVFPLRAEDWLPTLQDGTVDLILTDPPYFEITKEAWDNSWSSSSKFVDWFVSIFDMALPKLAPKGSLVFFGGIGKHGSHPLFEIILRLERSGYIFRNFVTWKKRRGYGKSHDYLYCREEIVWMSRDEGRTDVNFNIPLTSELRGYGGFNKAYPAKSPYKRVSNVWDDIGELMRPERTAQKPVPLMKRLVETHSHVDQLIIDPFVGWGTTGLAALGSNRRFLGCEAIVQDANDAEMRIHSTLGI